MSAATYGVSDMARETPHVATLLRATLADSWEKGRRLHHVVGAGDIDTDGATSPRPLRGEVGLRSNPGEGHGTKSAKSQVCRTRKPGSAWMETITQTTQFKYMDVALPVPLPLTPALSP